MENEYKLSNFVVYKESVLADRLKELCGRDKKEINPKFSAHTIHKLGLVYKQKSPHKISLLQSAVLLNAAIKRNPNPDFVDDLRRLCSEILKLSNAQIQDANLLQISREIYDDLCRRRKDLESNLDNLVLIPDNLNNEEFKMLETLKIEEVKDMQNKVTEDFLVIITNASKATIDILGKPSCKFALIGMGSLARNEVTLFSDFENVIILQDEIEAENYQEILEYFRWFSTILLLILINFGEMIIPCAVIPSISTQWFFDIFPFGMCPDGFGLNASKNAIGCDTAQLKVEHIKPISKMLECLDDANDDKNGIHFARILAQNCFVYGDKDVYDLFKEKAEIKLKTLRKQNVDFVSQMIEQFQECEKDFGYKEKLENMMKLSMVDVKRVLYRTISMFLSVIAKSHNLKSISSFEIISELHEEGFISADDARKLEFAVAISCEVRQKVYSKEKSQNDYLKMKMDDDNFVGTTGPISMAKCFAAMVGLQNSIKVGAEGKIVFYNNMHERFNKREQHSYFAVKHYQKALDVTREMIDSVYLSKEDLAYNFTFIAVCCFSMGRFEDAVVNYKRSLQEYENIKHDHIEILKCCSQLGLCLQLLYKFEDSLGYLLRLLELLNLSTPRQLDELALCYNSIAISYNALDRHEEAVLYYKHERDIRVELSKGGGMEEKAALAKTYAALGACLTQALKLEEALSCFRMELDIRRELFVITEHFDFPMKACNINIACCLNRLGRFAEAKPYFEIGKRNILPKPINPILQPANLHLEILGNRRITVKREFNEILRDLERIKYWEDTLDLYKK